MTKSQDWQPCIGDTVIVTEDLDSLRYAISIPLRKGEAVIITDKDPSNTSFHVTRSGMAVGWISIEYLEPTSLPAVESLYIDSVIDAVKRSMELDKNAMSEHKSRFTLIECMIANLSAEDSCYKLASYLKGVTKSHDLRQLVIDINDPKIPELAQFKTAMVALLEKLRDEEESIIRGIYDKYSRFEERWTGNKEG